MTLGEYCSQITKADGSPIDITKIETIAGYPIEEAIEILIRHRNKWYENIDQKLKEEFQRGYAMGLFSVTKAKE